MKGPVRHFPRLLLNAVPSILFCRSSKFISQCLKQSFWVHLLTIKPRFSQIQHKNPLLLDARRRSSDWLETN